MTTLKQKLIDLEACSEAIDWVGERSLTRAWSECERADWLLWLAARAGVDRRLVVEAACQCAESVLGLIPDGEERPAKALATARRWILGEATIEEVRSAAAYAYAAAAYAYAAAAAAAYAAAAAAAYAAAAAAAADARTQSLKEMAELVRDVIKVEDFPKEWRK